MKMFPLTRIPTLQSRSTGSDKKVTSLLGSESGQSVILVSMVILSFVMFFGFAINTGVLITAKISVQSAADAAAYAGAAVQARQMNAISYLNYDMRRQYKKFIYRYSFIGNVSSKNFPNDSLGSTQQYYGYPKDYYPPSNPVRSTVAIKVPVICIPITSTSVQNDTCFQLNLKSTSGIIDDAYPLGALSTLSGALLQGLMEIENMTRDLCSKNTGVNLYTLFNWLFRGNIDPSKMAASLSQMTQGLQASDRQRVINIVENLSKGLGLYPRNIVNLMRIETLEKFLNEPAKSDVNKETILSLEQAPTADANERTIQAFKSALANLNNEVMNHDSVTLKELQNSQQIALAPILPSFNTYVQWLRPDSSDMSNTKCNSKILPFRTPRAPVGVRRLPGPPVHYAVKVTAKAKLAFLPAGTSELDLEAFASAKPFGSRIGPHLTESDFVVTVKPSNDPLTGAPINDCSNSSTSCYLPLLSLVGSTNYMSPSFLQTMSQIGVATDSSGVKTFTFQGLNNAMAPNPLEVGRYNILPPPPSFTDNGEFKNQMDLEFIPYVSNLQSKVYRFYAPLFPGSGGDPTTRVETFMTEVFGNTQITGNNEFGIDMMQIKSQLQTNIIDYINNDLPSAGPLAELNESTTFAAVELPMSTPLNPSSQKYWLTTAKEVLSSWAPTQGRSMMNGGFKPRFGYSVKFVAMQNLLQAGMNDSDEDETKVSH